MEYLQELGGVGVVAPTPGSRSGDSGHVASKMMCGVFADYGSNVIVFTRPALSRQDLTSADVVHCRKPFSGSISILRLVGLIIYHINLAYAIMKKRNSLDIVIFGGWGLIIPILVSRSLGIRTLQRVGGHPIRVLKNDPNSNSLVTRVKLAVAEVVLYVNYKVVHKIAVITESMIDFNDLSRYTDKIIVWDHYDFDVEQIQPEKSFSERGNVIGFAGVFNEDKGVLTLLKSVPHVLHNIRHARVILVGDGPLLSECREFVCDKSIEGKVEFTGFVSRSRVIKYMNQMRLLVLPSRHEGLPKVLIEAMASATPVLTTNVGGTDDIISDGSNSFLLSDTDVETVQRNITEILDDDDLSRVSENARKYVENRYTQESVYKAYDNMVKALTRYSES